MFVPSRSLCGYYKSGVTMRNIALAALVLISSGINANAQPTDAVCTKQRVLIIPFANEGMNRGQTHFSLGLPATLAERFEGGTCVESVNGPLILTAEQVLLVSGQNDETVNLAAANRLASNKGASRFLTGSYRGTAEVWTLTVTVYAVSTDGPTKAGEYSVTGSQIEYVKTRSGKTVAVVGMNAIHTLLSQATAGAFELAGTPLPPADIAAIAHPSTKDSYAFLLLNRAYRRYFMAVASGDESALSVAEHAVRVDPKYAEAQRFYAYLLVENGRATKARLHYEVVLSSRPGDVRSLIALGKIEIGQNNADVAENYLKRAVAAKPSDPATHFWLARARLKRGNREGAVTSFERSRELDPYNMDARRELVSLYAADRRYDKASEELRAIVNAEPGNLDAVFQLASCLRASGKINEAIAIYDQAAPLFPKETRLARFKDDLAEPKSGGILDLVRVVSEGNALTSKMEEAHDRFQTSANDAVMNAGIEKKAGCDVSRSSEALARKTGDEYAGLGADLVIHGDFVRRAIARGDGTALAPDELTTAQKLLVYADRSKSDLREMEALYRNSVVPMVARSGCVHRGEPAKPADIDDILVRNDNRLVHIEAAKPSPLSTTISPEVPPDPARIIRFTVKNDADVEYLVTVDGDAARAAAVPPKREMTLTARVGMHKLCLLPKGVKCDDLNVRMVPLYERWSITIKAAD